jgi:hypothetical protein
VIGESLQDLMRSWTWTWTWTWTWHGDLLERMHNRGLYDWENARCQLNLRSRLGHGGRSSLGGRELEALLHNRGCFSMFS